jgi:anaerobic selenocysteine-containing dehydrogenase
MMNTADHTLAGVRRRMAFNPAHIHGDDLAALGLRDGAEVEIQSAAGAIPAIVKADASVRRGVISMTHGWGGVPGRDANYREFGSSTSQLVATDRQRETINAMPLMSAIPVRIVARAAAIDTVSAGAAVAVS